ncbi:hypothetical protein BB560_001987 [Smittium megazygosporum]|uniref:anthranilate synthase n=1 Tax=Smittium megazygosporum TaxID=133381 RepID=A0A2T9ZG22_9FUNG|nr:hypothetical protein BB560_001987 [Smittium megazygosporum]
MRTLIIDNYDSYTNNLVTLWCEAMKAMFLDLRKVFERDEKIATDSVPLSEILNIDFILENLILIRNDQYSWEFVEQNILPFVDNVIISPGPGHPENEKDFGICSKTILLTKKPILGICLGHQGIASCFGTKIVKAEVPVHGQKSALRILEEAKFPLVSTNCKFKTSLFESIPQGISVVRYHSLVVDEKG